MTFSTGSPQLTMIFSTTKQERKVLLMLVFLLAVGLLGILVL